eukprot:TRINITY_DN26477_c0_g1_i1.p1 TRINITY_DN26477_c0_g1~~TRINITY_DN26477_c0_g1_i1.p1  ORF type:complete len:475 (-),score=94.50 TRINITY_DN26477_c0_g1_i1:149-1573(-)
MAALLSALPVAAAAGATLATALTQRRPRQDVRGSARSMLGARYAVRCEHMELHALRDAVSRLDAEVRRLEAGQSAPPPIHRIVVTGGPCGGKSTVLGDLKQALEDRQFLVSVMPEVATQAFEWSGGRLWTDAASSERRSVEKSTLFLQLQIGIEDAILRMARTSLAVRDVAPSRPRGLVILYDRGCADYRAYCSSMQWSEVLERLGTTMTRLRDRRYDFVVHLVTAANGAEEYYTLEQAEGEVSARHESAAEAREVDVRIQRAWHGFANVAVVDNSQPFAEKRRRVRELVLQAVGVAGAARACAVGARRLRCRVRGAVGSSVSQISLAIREAAGQENCSHISVTMVYLSDFVRLQKRTIGGEEQSSFYQQSLGKDGNVERQYQISSWTYVEKRRAALESGESLREFQEEVIVYTKENEHVRHHVFLEDSGGTSAPVVLVEISDSHAANGLQLPTWLEIIEDVTAGHRFSTFGLA